jgi:hypothetical protein
MFGRKKPPVSPVHNIFEGLKAIEMIAAQHPIGHRCLMCRAAGGDAEAQAMALLELKKHGHPRAMDLPWPRWVPWG